MFWGEFQNKQYFEITDFNMHVSGINCTYKYISATDHLQKYSQQSCDIFYPLTELNFIPRQNELSPTDTSNFTLHLKH